MATETERKFLVRGEFIQESVKSINIIQRYLSVDPQKTIRIRTTDDSAFITIKSPRRGGMLSRSEWEFKIPLADATELMEICLPGMVAKTRYIVPAGKHKFEVDVFHDKNEGLVVAEIELAEEDEPFERPRWLGEEVTGDPRYYSSMLIK
jgi:CYTH domain-containing protein